MENMRELLAGCLRESSNGYVLDALFEKYPTISELMNADEIELRRVKGLGVIKSKQITAILQFVKAVNTPELSKRIIVRSPKDVYDLVKAELQYLQVEKFMVIGLNTKSHVLFKETVSSGSLNASIVHPRETFKNLIKRAAASCILVHNHPSSDNNPSQEDIELTNQLVQCGKILGIEVIDHVIVGAAGGGYISFKEKGLI